MMPMEQTSATPEGPQRTRAAWMRGWQGSWCTPSVTTQPTKNGGVTAMSTRTTAPNR